MAVVFAINAQLVRASERKCRPPDGAPFRASLRTAGLSLPVPHRTRRLVVEVARVMRREYREPMTTLTGGFHMSTFQPDSLLGREPPAAAERLEASEAARCRCN